MVSLLLLSLLSSSLGAFAQNVSSVEDPCALIAGQRWVSPKDVRACYHSFRVDEAEKANILDVVRKTLAFHASTNYQIRAPWPFHRDVHVNLERELNRIARRRYRSDYDFHLDLSQTFKDVQDGHCVWINYCYVHAYVNYLPIPLSLITDDRGRQNVHIAYEAYDVAFGSFADHLDYWEEALPDNLKGQLRSLSGAKVLAINGVSPLKAADSNARITGSYQSYATRQNSFFSSYRRSAGGWEYIMGDFAQQSLPKDDFAVLRILREGQRAPEMVRIPYRSRPGPILMDFEDAASFREKNCKADSGTNGRDIYASTRGAKSKSKPPPRGPQTWLNTILENKPSDAILPPSLSPWPWPVEGSFQVAQFYMLDDGVTGVLALGSFGVDSSQYFQFLESLLRGLVTLKSQGAQRLVVDVSNNSGGYICAAHWLHRIIVGPKSTTVPQAGLNTTARAGPLAVEIANKIADSGLDPDLSLLYNPLNWRDIDNQKFAEDDRWLDPPVHKIINWRRDRFSQTLGQECAPEGYPNDGPAEALFEGSQVVIVSNGRCASSCALFSVTMKKLEGARTVVVGGRKGVRQDYCGIVGGQSTTFPTIDTELKSTGLKDHPLAPPDLTVRGVQGITWRLGYGIDDPSEPEEWQEHWADVNLPLTAEISNRPDMIWMEVANRLF